MSRISVLLLAFHAKAWIFGAACFYLVWAFLAMVVISSLICMFRYVAFGLKPFDLNGFSFSY
jgi:hypothetical protein